MPFTPSHAVVALPFARTTPGLAAAVAVGAMTPDLPLFVRGIPLTYAITHSWAWIPLTSLVGGALLAVWWFAIRPAVREFSPRRLADRLPGEWDDCFRLGRPARGIPILFGGLALGVATHIAWDAFTHEGRAGAVALGLDAAWGPLPAYRWLQYGSSAVGLAILVVAAATWLRRRTPVPATRVLPDLVRVAWWMSLPAVILIAWLGGLAALGPFTDEFTPHHLAYRVLPPAVAAWAVLSLVLCVVIQARRRGRAFA
jgi:hypothetical protein